MTADLNNPKESSVELSPSDSLAPYHVKTSNMVGPCKELEAFIAKNPNIFGAADIYTVHFQSPLTLAEMLTAVLTELIDKDRRPAVHNFLVVIPPGWDAKKCEEKAWRGIVNAFSLLADRQMQPGEQAWLKSRFQLTVAPNWRTSCVLDIISKQPEYTAIIVAEAASYRDDSISSYIAAGAPSRAEDVWVPQLHAFATASVKLAKKLNCYVALGANQFSPSRKILSELLMSVKGCGVMGSSSEESPDSILAARVDQWDAWIREGRLGSIFRDIKQLPANLDSNKPFLHIQVLHKAGHFYDALQAVRQEVAHGHELDPQMSVKLARIVQDAGASIFAAELLSPAITELHSLEHLESALVTMEDAGSTELEKKVEERLNELFPGSSILRHRLVRKLVSSRDYAGAANIMAEEPDGKAEFYDTLSKFLSGDSMPDYKGLIDLAGGNTSQADAYRMVCANDALSRKLTAQAFELVIPLPNTPAQTERGEMLLLRSIKQILLLNGENGTPSVESEGFQAAVISLIERLAANPKNQALRLGFNQLIQPSVTGSIGLALMASILLKLASRPVRLEKRSSPGKADMNWLLQRKSFLKTLFEWLQSEAPIVIGRAMLPAPLLTEPADEVVSALTDYLERSPLESEKDIGILWLYLALATSVTPYSSDPDYDLQLMRLVAGRFASSGHTQMARDLTEQILLNCTATPRRRRLGWFAMADIYQRCHIKLEAFSAMTCTFAADDKGDEWQICHEIFSLARLLRDSGLHKHARSAIEKGRKILERVGLSETYSHRLDTLDLQIRQQNLQMGDSGKADLEVLLTDAVRNGEAVLEHYDATEPAAVMLGQLLRQAREIGASIPAKADSVYAELLKHVKGIDFSLISTMTAVAPSADELLTLIKTNSFTRYSDDVGYDMFNTAIVAGRALAKDDYISDAINTSFALEILSDRGVGVPGWDEASEPPPPLQNIYEPAEIARSISCEGLSVVQAGFDSSGRLVRVSSVDGHIEAPVRESDDLMLAERFMSWSKKYPYGYGIDEESVNRKRLFNRTLLPLQNPSVLRQHSKAAEPHSLEALQLLVNSRRCGAGMNMAPVYLP